MCPNLLSILRNANNREKRMKKNLLSKTAFAAILALSGSAAIADSIPAGSGPGKENFDLFIGGYYKFYAGWASNTGSDKTTKVKNKKFDFLSDAEIDFRFEGKTDSNLRYGAVVELLANPGGGVSSATAQEGFSMRKLKVAERKWKNKKNLINADETYAYFEDSWGRVELGNTDGASDAFAYYAPNKFGTGGIDGLYEDFLGELGSDQKVSGYKPMDTGDSLKASYYTPRYAGFQAGVSYIPQPGREGRRIDFSKCLGKANKNLFDGRPLTNDEFTNATELAANYVNTFGDVGFAFYGAWTRANAKEYRRTNYKEWQSFGLGTNVTYKGWTAGGSFVYDGRSGYARKIKKTIRSQVRGYGASAGLMYEVGPWTAGMNWAYGRGAGNVIVEGHNYQHVLASGVTYQLLKGVKVDFEVVYRNKSVKQSVASSGPSSRFKAKRSHDWAVISGVKMNF